MAETMEFHNPVKIHSGLRALENLPFELDAMNSARPLILVDEEAARAGLDRVIEEAFGDSGLVMGFHTGIGDAPVLPLVRELAGLYRARGFDALVAVGKGAVMDVAKVLNIAVSGRPEDLESFAGIDGVPGRLGPLLTVPTQGGDGREASRFAALGGRSYSSRHLMPDLVFIDPRMLAPGDRASGTAGLLTAWVHATETYFTAPGNLLAEAYAGGALALLRESLDPGLKGPVGPDERVRLANASVYAACAFSNVPAGPAHLLGEAAARESGLPPGAVMGLLLPPAVARFVAQGHDCSRLLPPLAGMEGYARTPEGQRGRAVPVVLERMLAGARDAAGGAIPRNLRDAGLSRERLPEMAREAAAGEGAWSEDEFLAVLDAAWSGGGPT